jgi:hypothetical protein
LSPDGTTSRCDDFRISLLDDTELSSDQTKTESVPAEEKIVEILEKVSEDETIFDTWNRIRLSSASLAKIEKTFLARHLS